MGNAIENNNSKVDKAILLEDKTRLNSPSRNLQNFSANSSFDSLNTSEDIKREIEIPPSGEYYILERVKCKTFSIEEELKENEENIEELQKIEESKSKIKRKLFPYYKSFKVDEYVLLKDFNSKIYKIVDINVNQNNKVMKRFELLEKGESEDKKFAIDPSTTKLMKFYNLNILIIHSNDEKIYEKILVIDINNKIIDINEQIKTRLFPYIKSRNYRLIYKSKDISIDFDIEKTILQRLSAEKRNENLLNFNYNQTLVELNYNFAEDHLAIIIPEVESKIFNFLQSHDYNYSRYFYFAEILNVFVFSKDVIIKSLLIAGPSNGSEFDKIDFRIYEANIDLKKYNITSDNTNNNVIKEFIDIEEMKSDSINQKYFW